MSESNTKSVMAAPAALFVVGCISLGIFALLTRQVPGSTIPVLNVWTTAAGIAIIIAGVIELVRGNIAFGTLILISGSLLSIGAGWGFAISTGAQGTIFGNGLTVERWEEGLQVCGWIWLGIGVVQLLMLGVAAKISWGMFISQIIAGVGALLLAFGLVQRIGFGDGVVNIAGWIFLVYAIYAFYAATAFVTNAVYGRKVMPI